MRIYTRTGDEGETGLFGGGRVSKDHPRIAAYGTIDELNAVIGLARCHLAAEPNRPDPMDQLLADIQHHLFDCGAELASPNRAKGDTLLINDAAVEHLERMIDLYEGTLPPLREFILPGGSPAAAQLHVARCVCRRAERLLVALGRAEPVRGEALRYLNRLGDLLFVLARAANQAAGVADVPWQRGSP